MVLALLSAGSYESEVCQGEQLRSLRRHKCVIPLLVQSDTVTPVYLEARQYRDFSEPALYAARLQILLEDIENRPVSMLAVQYRQTLYDTVPPLPPNFVARPADLEALRQLLLSDRGHGNVALVALRDIPGQWQDGVRPRR